jgi:hypothetical protein
VKPIGWRKLRQRFGIAAPRVAIRTHVPWYLRLLMIVFVLSVSAALAAWIYDAGRRFAGFDRSEVQAEVADLRRDKAESHAELERLRAIANASESKISIERSTQATLAQQIRTLEQENARLREDLAIFENMLAAEPRGAQGLTIQRFKFEPDAVPGEFRYRLVLINGTRRERTETPCRLEFLVTVQRDGRSDIITFPEKSEQDASRFRFVLRQFQRVEGVLKLSPEARVSNVQVRVYEGAATQPKATQAIRPGS